MDLTPKNFNLIKFDEIRIENISYSKKASLKEDAQKKKFIETIDFYNNYLYPELNYIIESSINRANNKFLFEYFGVRERWEYEENRPKYTLSSNLNPGLIISHSLDSSSSNLLEKVEFYIFDTESGIQYKKYGNLEFLIAAIDKYFSLYSTGQLIYLQDPDDVEIEIQKYLSTEFLDDYVERNEVLSKKRKKGNRKALLLGGIGMVLILALAAISLTF